MEVCNDVRDDDNNVDRDRLFEQWGNIDQLYSNAVNRRIINDQLVIVGPCTRRYNEELAMKYAHSIYVYGLEIIEDDYNQGICSLCHGLATHFTRGCAGSICSECIDIIGSYGVTCVGNQDKGQNVWYVDVGDHLMMIAECAYRVSRTVYKCFRRNEVKLSAKRCLEITGTILMGDYLNNCPRCRTWFAETCKECCEVVRPFFIRSYLVPFWAMIRESSELAVLGSDVIGVIIGFIVSSY